ncbi:hypothetical protein UFOVP648_5 [uncultured Caudovirales phage]|uniref:Uncharacterized protein n=1 Tax=uncultured Caudovirales phage TaxID=2100421 RepID=A0A6J5NAG3_9CAUD|nr:hypothetical protein UFOVP648_5 [uncultured Caudovirales phage]
MKMTTNKILDYFIEVYEKKYNEIKGHGRFKYILSNEQAEEILANIYLSISNTFINNVNKDYDLNTEKKMLNYIYFCFSSQVKQDYKKQQKVQMVSLDELDFEIEDDSTKTELEEVGKSLFFDEVFIFLQEKIDKNEIKEIHVAVFKYFLYNNMTVIQISNATGMRRTLIEYSITKISNLLKEHSKIKQLYLKYITSIEL